MAARPQPTNSRRCPRVVAVAAATTLAFVVPSVASAHSGTLVHALDYRAVVTSTGASGAVVSATSLDGDRKLELHVAPTATLVVLGYQGEPFLRFSPAGVEVNERSPSAIVNRLSKRGAEPALDPRARSAWSPVSREHRYAWHDHRLGPAPGRVYADGSVAGWSVPIEVDGHREAIAGRLLHARGPPLWPWLVLVGATAATAAVLLGPKRSQRAAETALFSCAAAAGIAAVILSVSFGFVPGRPVSGAWTTVAVCGVISAAALAVFARAPRARHAVAGFVAVLAVLVALSEASVLVHGFVISSLPAAVVRGAVATAASAGAIAAACAAVLLFGDDRRRGPPRRGVRVRMAVPRGRTR